MKSDVCHYLKFADDFMVLFVVVHVRAYQCVSTVLYDLICDAMYDGIKATTL